MEITEHGTSEPIVHKMTMNYPYDMSMQRAYVVLGHTGKVSSSRDQEILFPVQGSGENLPIILCIIWLICV